MSRKASNKVVSIVAYILVICLVIGVIGAVVYFTTRPQGIYLSYNDKAIRENTSYISLPANTESSFVIGNTSNWGDNSVTDCSIKIVPNTDDSHDFEFTVNDGVVQTYRFGDIGDLTAAFADNGIVINDDGSFALSIKYKTVNEILSAFYSGKSVKFNGTYSLTEYPYISICLIGPDDNIVTSVPVLVVESDDSDPDSKPAGDVVDDEKPLEEPDDNDDKPTIVETFKIEVQSDGDYYKDDSGVYHFTSANARYYINIVPTVSNTNFEVSTSVSGRFVVGDYSRSGGYSNYKNVDYSDIILSYCNIDELLWTSDLERLQSLFGELYPTVNNVSSKEEFYDYLLKEDLLDCHMKNIGSYSNRRVLIETGDVKLSSYYEGCADKDGGYYDGRYFEASSYTPQVTITVTDTISNTSVSVSYIFDN